MDCSHSITTLHWEYATIAVSVFWQTKTLRLGHTRQGVGNVFTRGTTGG